MSTTPGYLLSRAEHTLLSSFENYVICYRELCYLLRIPMLSATWNYVICYRPYVICYRHFLYVTDFAILFRHFTPLGFKGSKGLGPAGAGGIFQIEGKSNSTSNSTSNSNSAGGYRPCRPGCMVEVLPHPRATFGRGVSGRRPGSGHLRWPAYRPETIRDALHAPTAPTYPAALPRLPKRGAAARQRRIAWPSARKTGRRRRPPRRDSAGVALSAVPFTPSQLFRAAQFITMARRRLTCPIWGARTGRPDNAGATGSGSNTSAKSGSGIIHRPPIFLAPGSLLARIQSRMVSGSRLSTRATWQTPKATWPGYCVRSKSSMRADIAISQALASVPSSTGG